MIRIRTRLLVTLVAFTVIGGALWTFYPTIIRPKVVGSQPSPYTHSTKTQLATPGPAWHLSFKANFSGSELNTSVWATCYPWINLDSGCTNFGNTEYEWYLPSQDRVSGGILHLVAQRTPTAGRTNRGEPKEFLCRSGMVTTYPSFRFEYGSVQIVARIPLAAGLWSGLWLAAADLRWPPEIDILEYWGAPTARAGAYFHPVGSPQISAHPTTRNLSVGWHTFTLYWTASRLIWFIDGRAILSTDEHIPHQMMYFIADLADYKLQSADSCNGELLMRSIKVWQTGPK